MIDIGGCYSGVLSIGLGWGLGCSAFPRPWTSSNGYRGLHLKLAGCDNNCLDWQSEMCPISGPRDIPAAHPCTSSSPPGPKGMKVPFPHRRLSHPDRSPRADVPPNPSHVRFLDNGAPGLSVSLGTNALYSGLALAISRFQLPNPIPILLSYSHTDVMYLFAKNTRYGADMSPSP
ncbi:hypothetical protein B0H65DRAFT_438182 [Neurospora tetraspora]|uniref:Uncharacterized protein n=1 Tax=Neurospora tetraspora TaxID=94610 RepID=A0AAE0JP27_9PEZI|nr:hypothetical protein B0H65DRAFT_438182 [Neurospora tetraspora]